MIHINGYIITVYVEQYIGQNKIFLNQKILFLGYTWLNKIFLDSNKTFGWIYKIFHQSRNFSEYKKSYFGQ